MCRRGLQTSTLFKTKIAHFAARLRLETLLSDPDLFVLHTELSIFQPKIVEIDIEEKIVGIANADRSSQVFTLHTLFTFAN